MSATSLQQTLHARILESGPITFHEWMQTALYDPDHGYYNQPVRPRWGREGDYRTSPERSVLFAATFARYFASLHEELGGPTPFTLVESGGGAAGFASGVLRTLQSRFPEFYRNTTYIVDERSADANRLAVERLQPFAPQVQVGRLAELDQIDAGIVFANELLDAFPVHRVTVRDGQLLEFHVGVTDTGEFEWQLAAPSTERLTEYFLRSGVSPLEGQITEVNLDTENWLRMVAARLRKGFLVLVDYGAEAEDLYRSPARRQGTLRAFRRHRLMPDILAQPGSQDLTTTVDWTHVRAVSGELGFQPVAFSRQDKFLLDAGILGELEQQTAGCNAAEAMRIRTDAREMILPTGMAADFQVMVLKKS